MYRLRIRTAVKRDVDRLPGHVRQRVRSVITALAGDPRPAQAKPLRALPHCYRIRVNHWRVIYEVIDADRTVHVLAVRRKTGPETYQGL